MKKIAKISVPFSHFLIFTHLFMGVENVSHSKLVRGHLWELVLS